MKNMNFYILTVLLLLAATLIECKAKSIESAELRRVAAQESGTLDTLKTATFTEVIGGAMCLTGIIAWVVSRRRKERGTQVIPVVLLVSYVLMLLIVV